jgi:hypothetical protein
LADNIAESTLDFAKVTGIPVPAEASKLATSRARA